MQCPQCGKEIRTPKQSCRPFCSDRCKLIDLGKWISEDYHIAAEDREESDGDATPKHHIPEKE